MLGFHPMRWDGLTHQSNPCGGCLRIRDDEVQWHHGNLDGVDIGAGFVAGTLVPCCHPAWVAYLAYLLNNGLHLAWSDL